MDKDDRRYIHESGMIYGAFKDPDTGKGWISFIEEPNHGDGDASYGYDANWFSTMREAVKHAREFLDVEGNECYAIYDAQTKRNALNK